MNTSRWIIGAVIVAALVGLFVVLKPTANPEPAPPTTTTTTATATADPAAPEVYTFVVTDREVEGPETITVQAGTTVDLTITSDQDGEIHVHGYEIEKEIAAGDTETVTVVADAPGLFEVALHPDPELALTELEVTP